MNKSILIAGKDLPDGSDFVDGAEIRMRSIVITKAPNVKVPVASNIKVLSWLRTSPVNARTLIVDTDTSFGMLNEAVLYFDEAYYAEKFNTLTTQECSQAVDEMILGYQYLALEILSRYEKYSIMNAGLENDFPTPKLVFLIRRNVSEYDIKKNPVIRSQAPMASTSFVAAAAAAFEAFAENTAALFSPRSYVNIILARGEWNNETAKSDRSLGEWICTYMDELDEQKKSSFKPNLSWVKAGAKARGFLFF